MKAHTKSEPGIVTHQMENRSPTISPFPGIHIPFKVLSIVWRFQGEIWRSSYHIIIKVPPQAWIRYGEDEMNLEDKHNFEQLAWIQVSQYNATDLIKAIQQTTTYEEVTNNTKQWHEYQVQNLHKQTYLRTIYLTKVYAVLDQWTIEEAKRGNFHDDHFQVPLEFVAQKVLTSDSNHVPPHNQTKPLYYFNEEWDTASSNSESGQ